MAYICPECGREFGNAGALGSHRSAKHGAAARQGPNRKALEATLRELRQGERLAPIDAAYVQAARSLADAVDKEDTNAQLWRTYREMLEGLVKPDDDSDSFEKLLAEINSRAPVGHPPEA